MQDVGKACRVVGALKIHANAEFTFHVAPHG
jgi:hypothetical protein